MPEPDAVFEEHRPALARLAYRMLGSLADADDVVQDAYLRWTRANRAPVEAPRAYLFSVVTNLCIDRRQAIDARKEAYVGPWLPEPVVETDPSRGIEAAESVSLALLVVLEALTPLERAAFLLKRVFNYDYAEIAAMLGKAEPACRQLVSRAERQVHERRPRFEADPVEAERLTGAFLNACATGDLDGLLSVLAPDAVFVSDGGGKATAALVPIRGADRVARLFLGLTRKAPAGTEYRRVWVNGRPGLIAVYQGQVANVLTFDVADERIVACY
ncbi:MAG: RNA polymerase sigma-70 factor, partial [Isosphaeraceae bacterium]|nr:RNA polymerase sigma-70 factor [Isosphaeraceae bacterium]